MTTSELAVRLIERAEQAAAAEPAGEVVLRRRRTDWTGGPRPEHPIGVAQQAVLEAAAATLVDHDRATGRHSDDVVALTEAIAERMGIGGTERMRLLAAAQLHDIGKVGVPRRILEKRGPLDADEWAVVEEHTLIGERILRAVPDMGAVARLVRSSHERWDGGGYPDGLAGDEIPLGARIVFCADAYHAIRCERPYRPGRSAAEALAELRAASGSQFDPLVVDALHDAARSLRGSAAARARALAGGFRGRRAAALLLTLTLGASALAAVGVRPGNGRSGSEGAGSAACAPGAECLPASLGPLGDPFSGAAGFRIAAERSGAPRAAAQTRRAGRGISTSSASRPAAARRGAGRGEAGRGSLDVWRGPAERGESPAGPSPGRRPATAPPAQPRSGQPQSRGRSRQAPGKPVQSGKPLKAGAPGRAEEAPAKPLPTPGAFGKGQQ